jgi:DNA repair protein RecO (recombination protein O)
MQNLSSQALVLKTSLLRESDLLVDLYSLELGKISAVAKGVKSRKSRWANRFSLFSQIQFEALKGSGLAKLIKAESLKSLTGLSAIDLALLSTIGEVVGQLVFPGQTNEQIYKLLREVQALFNPQKTLDQPALMLIVWSKLLTILGFIAILTHCSG